MERSRKAMAQEDGGDFHTFPLDSVKVLLVHLGKRELTGGRQAGSRHQFKVADFWDGLRCPTLLFWAKVLR